MPRVAVWACLAVALCAGAWAQQRGSSDLEAGSLLVSDESLKEPAFAQTVILLIHYDVDGTVGLIVNRPTKTPLSEVFPDQTAAKHGADPIFEGGPVDDSGVLGLLRSPAEVKDAGHVFADVYATTAKNVLGGALSSGQPPNRFRAYLGYCGWAQGQLEFEIEAGAWHVMEGDVKLVFDSDPGTLWRRLFDRTNLQVVRRETSNPAAGFVAGELDGFKRKVEKHAPAIRPVG